ncbi:MAG: DUF1015 domain-containing protein [Myxococcales bacterium]|nr:DUF1015 domain-containing protein [Myxococcales bacterium]
MADIAPLNALRYATPEHLSQVTSPPYDDIDEPLLEELRDRSPFNMVRIDLPQDVGDTKYRRAATRLEDWITQGVLRFDDGPMILRYEQSFSVPGVAGPVNRRGFLALVRAEPYGTGAVLPHERTFAMPREDRRRLLHATRASLSPVFLLYRDPSGVVGGVLGADRNDEGSEGATRFETEDGVVHQLEPLTDSAQIRALTEALRETSLLIADGHHRYEAAVACSGDLEREWTEAGKAPNPRGGHRYALAYFVDEADPGLLVFPTHRHVAGFRRLDREAFLAQLGQHFRCERREGAVTPPTDPRTITLVFSDGVAHDLHIPATIEGFPDLDAQGPLLRELPVTILHEVILRGILGVLDASRISFFADVGDAAGPEGPGLSFLLPPVAVSTVRRIAEAGQFMPQKSTYFYPKVPAGLAIHRLDPAVPAPGF